MIKLIGVLNADEYQHIKSACEKAIPFLIEIKR